MQTPPLWHQYIPPLEPWRLSYLKTGAASPGGGEFAVDTPPPPSADFWKKQGVSVKTFFIKDFLSKNIFRRAGKRGVSIELSSDTNFNLDNSQIWKKKRVVFSFGGETDYHCSIECSLGFDWTFCQNDR